MRFLPFLFYRDLFSNGRDVLCGRSRTPVPTIFAVGEGLAPPENAQRERRSLRTVEDARPYNFCRRGEVSPPENAQRERLLCACEVSLVFLLTKSFG